MYTSPMVFKNINVSSFEKSADIERLVKDKEAFHAFIYTPIEAVKTELDQRRYSSLVPSPSRIPDILAPEPRAVFFRQVITPNFETRKFLDRAHTLSLRPLFWEYHQDKFTSNNEWKHALGKLQFLSKRGKRQSVQIEKETIIDFNLSNGKILSHVHTHWKQPLIDFHHEFFEHYIERLGENIFEASDWFSQNGGTAAEYYKNFLSLFLKHGVLFENFLLNERELSFTRDIFLPAFIAVYRTTGYKPLVVPFEPFTTETDDYWMCYPGGDKSFLKEKLM